MSRIVIVFSLFLFTLNLFGQTTLKGVVVSDNSPLAHVEVVNVTKRISKTTDDKGRFSIEASVYDELLFAAKNYNERRVKVNRRHFSSEAVFELEKKTIELKEVEIAKAEKIQVEATYEATKMAQLEKQQAQPKVIGVYTGEIEMGTDFVEIGVKVIKFLDRQLAPKKDSGVAKKTVSFKQYVRREFSNEFFTSKLDLKESEIDPFITFCENDLKSRDIIQQNGVLDVLQFLIEKRSDFKN
ncbi:hypothetical protein [Flavobacterium pedocola]